MSQERAARLGEHAPITQAMEDYLKTIFQLEEELGGRVTTQAIADRLGVQCPSVTNMLKRLAAMALVEHQPYRGVALTPRGRLVALEVIRHHRLLELYLTRALGYSWDAVHEEADRLEHSISEELEARIDAALGYPETDPHGHPIPRPSGELPSCPAAALADLAGGTSAIVARVSDREPEHLRRLAQLGIAPGTPIQVLRAASGRQKTMTVALGDAVHELPLALARDVYVRPVES